MNFLLTAEEAKILSVNFSPAGMRLKEVREQILSAARNGAREITVKEEQIYEPVRGALEDAGFTLKAHKGGKVQGSHTWYTTISW